MLPCGKWPHGPTMDSNCHVWGVMSVSLGIAQPTAGGGAENGSGLEGLAGTWSSFYADYVAPFIALLVPVIVIWLLLVLLARLFAMTPGLPGSRTRRATSRIARVTGFILTLSAAIAFVLAAVRDAAGLSGPEAVPGVVFAMFGVPIYGFGMATRPRLAATVTAPSGEVNAALTNELLARMRELNADDARGRVEQPAASDLNEIVAVAGKSDNWVVNLVGGALTHLINLTPWRLDVTVLDKQRAIAVVTRNGKRVREAQLRLPVAPSDSNHAGELVALAAAFGAITVAACYSDIRGFYGAQDWRGIGMLAAADQVGQSQRNLYLRAATEADARSILVEHAALFQTYRPHASREELERVMDSLEPMIRQAARLAGISRPEFQQIKPKFWHQEGNGSIEPTLLMLRMMTWYTTLLRNWLVQIPEADKRDSSMREQRGRDIVDVFVDTLRSMPKRDRLAAPNDLVKMRHRAALCYSLLQPEELAEGNPGGASDLPHDDAARSRWLSNLVGEISQSTEYEVRYSYACYLARRWARGDAVAGASPSRIAERVRDVCDAVDYYQRIAPRDPELLLLKNFDPVREAVLPRLIDSWDLRRFGTHRRALESAGILDPAWLASSTVSVHTLTRAGIEESPAHSLLDGARILVAAQNARAGMDDASRLRGAWMLIDVEGHSAATLKSAFAASKQEVVDAVASAIYWAPDGQQKASATRFVERLVREASRPRR